MSFLKTTAIQHLNASTPAINLDANGNVSVGNTSPASSKLRVYSQDPNLAVGLRIDANTNHMILSDTAENDTNSNYWYMYRNGGDGKLKFWRNAGDKVVFDANGKITCTGHVGSVATFFGYATSASATAIVNNNSGYIDFATHQNTDTSVFSLINTGNYGITINKSGFIYFNYNQDITSSGSGSYITGTYYINGTGRSQLISETNNAWDCIMLEGVNYVTAGSTLQFTLSAGNITGMDGGGASWSFLNILWIGG